MRDAPCLQSGCRHGRGAWAAGTCRSVKLQYAQRQWACPAVIYWENSPHTSSGAFTAALKAVDDMWVRQGILKLTSWPYLCPAVSTGFQYVSSNYNGLWNGPSLGFIKRQLEWGGRCSNTACIKSFYLLNSS